LRIIRRQDVKPLRISDSGASGVSEGVIADQARGCGRFAARKVFIASGGRTARFGNSAGTLIVLLEGTVGASSPTDGLEIMSPGDAVILTEGEECRIINHGNDRAVVLKVDGVR